MVWSFHPKQESSFAKKVLSIPRGLYREWMDLLCPPCCTICAGELIAHSDILCSACWEQLQQNLLSPACPVCGHNVGPYALINGRCRKCQNKRPVVSKIVRVGDYSNIMRHLILMFKFHRKSHLDSFLGNLLASAVIGNPNFDTIDMAIPIPLHWRRRWSRKYNQAELLAYSTAQSLKLQGRPVPVNCDLIRVRHTEPQSSLSPTDRLANLTGAFAVRRNADYQQKHICLIDDVTTTGTTLRVAARTLKQAGARQVSAAVLAVAAND